MDLIQITESILEVSINVIIIDILGFHNNHMRNHYQGGPYHMQFPMGVPGHSNMAIQGKRFQGDNNYYHNHLINHNFSHPYGMGFGANGGPNFNRHPNPNMYGSNNYTNMDGDRRLYNSEHFEMSQSAYTSTTASSNSKSPRDKVRYLFLIY